MCNTVYIVFTRLIAVCVYIIHLVNQSYPTAATLHLFNCFYSVYLFVSILQTIIVCLFKSIVAIAM